MKHNVPECGFSLCLPFCEGRCIGSDFYPANIILNPFYLLACGRLVINDGQWLHYLSGRLCTQYIKER